ncbi:CAMK family protein kinase [Tritrichomonas foetus]|uniref:non-specific serine/threonine protein kinase n=1 Tax=Tritrichomonas foetus TaxID=1144522 RepID=A0A1J4KA47_9EUKA|nr:CAMK family protein kinase [Tritrichomonas foetus]|eukprot:OHT06526.1 CAMK family protein kinase [Tritrichomonas foetus]
MLQFENYTILSQLNEGAHAKVYLAKHNDLDVQVAIKSIPKSTLQTEKDKEWLRREIECHKKADFKFVTPLYEIIETNDSINLVMQYEKNGTLGRRLPLTGRGISEDVAKRWFFQIILALRYIHDELNVIHRDIKLENIMFDENDIIKIIDFGFSKDCQDSLPFAQHHTICGSPCYTAPEVFTGNAYSKMADVYSAGVVLYLMTAGKLPHFDNNITNLFAKIVKEPIEIPKYFSDDLTDLVQKMLQVDPKKRITIKEIIEHPWLEQFHYLGTSQDMKQYSIIKRPILYSLKSKGFDQDIIYESIKENKFDNYHGMYRILADNWRQVIKKRKSAPSIVMQPGSLKSMSLNVSGSFKITKRGRVNSGPKSISQLIWQ